VKQAMVVQCRLAAQAVFLLPFPHTRDSTARLMTVFIGDGENSRAGRCALKINWAFSSIVKPRLEAAYSGKLAGYLLH
jgi:hypothetical protein